MWVAECQSPFVEVGRPLEVAGEEMRVDPEEWRVNSRGEVCSKRKTGDISGEEGRKMGSLDRSSRQVREGLEFQAKKEFILVLAKNGTTCRR